MRKISLFQISIFVVFFSMIVMLGLGISILLFGNIELRDLRGVFFVAACGGLILIIAILIFRLFLWVTPLKEGEIAMNSDQEVIYHIYLLFFLLFFHPVMRSGIIPVPLMKVIYLALGAKLGTNSYSSGILFDPMFVEVGSNSMIGQNALLVPHSLENDRLAHFRIRIGDNVTIGAHAVVHAGVVIDNNALVASGAVITKNTHIKEGEIWGGVPAKRIR